MSTKALLLELLVSGFFAVACFKARKIDIGKTALAPRDMLRLTDRLERLRLSRWQWFSMVLLLVIVRLQTGVPMVVELTAALQFIVFLALPTMKPEQVKPPVGGRSERERLSGAFNKKLVSRGKARAVEVRP